MIRRGITISVIFSLIIFCFYIVPNLFNQRERDHFSLTVQLRNAEQLFEGNSPDSVYMPISTFYDRSQFVQWLFGSHYRDIWTQPILLPVFKGFDTLGFKKVGGGMQTTSIELKDVSKRSFTLRSLDKDQSRPLPDFLRPSALRPLLRDQTSALNPYAAPVVSQLSKTLNLWHTNPKVYVVPPLSNYSDSTELLLVGKAVLFEEELSSKWKNKPVFNRPLDIINTEEMLTMLVDEKYQLDTLMYLKSRLFDILISDWDRHGGQWKWIIFEDSTRKVIEPFPIDRDMAFGCFDDGLVNKLVVSVSNKFKSFRSSKESILDGAKKISDLDLLLLKDIDLTKFQTSAAHIASELSIDNIREAFTFYPPDIYELIGEEHIQTLNSRKNYIVEAAEHFHKHINN